MDNLLLQTTFSPLNNSLNNKDIAIDKLSPTANKFYTIVIGFILWSNTSPFWQKGKVLAKPRKKNNHLFQGIKSFGFILKKSYTSQISVLPCVSPPEGGTPLTNLMNISVFFLTYQHLIRQSTEVFLYSCCGIKGTVAKTCSRLLESFNGQIL